MIYGNVNNEFFEEQAAVLPKPLQSAVRFLKETDLANHEPGRFDIELDGVPMILQVLDLTTAPRESLRPEIHRVNIDVQYLAAGGPERAAYYNDDKMNETDEDLLGTPRDICFYKNRTDCAEGTIELNVGTYAVYFPWDVHVPAVQCTEEPAPIRKIVIKVPMESCL